jgi:hypothetical protein
MESQPSSTFSGLSTGPFSVQNAQCTVEMVFRFWGANAKNSEPRAVNDPGDPGLHPGMLALIEDTVLAKRGVVLTARDQLHVSGLKQPADALVISRQVQLGLQGFRTRHASAPIAISIAIDAGSAHPPQTASAQDGSVAEDTQAATTSANGNVEPPHELVTLLKLSKPAQILLTHDLCRQMTDLHGLPLKSFSGRFGVYEYLWAAEDKLDLLQSEPQWTLTALPAQAVTGSHPAANQKSDFVTARTTTKAFDLPKSPDAMVQEAKGPFHSPRVLALAGIGIAALGAVIAMSVHVAHRSAAPSPAVAAPASSAPVEPAATTPVVTHATQPASAPIAKPHAANANHGAAKPNNSKPAAAVEETPVAESNQASSPAQAPAPQGCAQEMQPARLVALGEQYRGRGDYANAIRIFREVLACDPNNAQAREGLDKAAQGQRQH